MSDILNIGLSGLLAYKSALTYTAQNIANVATPYYSRRQIEITEALFSSGVNIGDVSRVYDAGASANLRNSNSLYSMYDEYQTQLSQLETMLQGDTNSIGTYISDTITAIRDLNVSVNTPTARSNYMNKLNVLSQRFNSISGQISQQKLNINTSLQTITTTINQLTGQIALVNQQIAANTGQDNSSLLDQQESLVQTLAQYLNFSTQTDSTGQLEILLNNGLELVSDGLTTQLSTVPDPSNPSNLLIQLDNGGSGVNITPFITSGEIAGLYSTQSSLQQAEAGLGQLALCIMDMMNTQNNLGIDFYGNLGKNIFVDVNGPDAINQRVIPNTNNTGSENMTVSITNSQQVTSSDYTLTFDGASNYTLTRLSDNTVVSSGSVTSFPQEISVDGFTLSLNSGTIGAGDSFTISPTRGMADAMELNITDPNLFAMGWPVVANAATTNSGTGTISVMSINDTTNSAFSIPQELNPPIKIQFLSATQFQLVNANTSAVIEGPINYTPGQQPVGFAIFPTPGNYDPGYRVSIFGSVNAGDSFNIGYQSNASGDNRNGLVMENLYTSNTMANGTLSYTSAYQLLANNVSGQTSEANIGYNSSYTILQQANENYAQVSGVSVEEEISNLMLYQQAFAASAQVLTVAKDIYDILNGLARM